MQLQAGLLPVPRSRRDAFGSQYVLLNFGSRRFWQLRKDADVAWNHVMCDAGTQMLDQGHRIKNTVGYRCHYDHDLIFSVFAGYSNGGRFTHGGVAQYFYFDLIGRNVFASAPDRIFHTIDEKVVAVLVFIKDVPGMKPAIAPGVCGCLRIIRACYALSPAAQSGAALGSIRVTKTRKCSAAST